MDPASIIGVIGVAAQALKLIKVYGDAVSDCRDEVARLRVELFCLKSALTQIERDVLLAPEHEAAEFKWMLEEARSLLVSLTESIQVGASRGSRLAQRLTWPLKRQHVKDLTGQLERMKTYFILVATSDTRDATKALTNSLDGIQQSLADMRTSEEDKMIQAAVDTWLTSFDPEIAHHAALSARFEGTNRWFLDGALAEWLKSNSRLLWLRGKPGAGKTCIAAASAARYAYVGWLLIAFDLLTYIMLTDLWTSANRPMSLTSTAPTTRRTHRGHELSLLRFCDNSHTKTLAYDTI
jgi:hypothetical protein